MQLLNLFGRIDLAVSELQRQQTALETLMIWGLESWKMRTSRRQTIRQLEHPESPAGGLRSPQLEDCGLPSWRIAESAGVWLTASQLEHCGVPSWRTGRSPAGGTLQLGKGTTTTTTKGLNDRSLNNEETEEQTREEQKKKEKNNN